MLLMFRLTIILSLGTKQVWGAYGGSACTIQSSAPGNTAQCNGPSNGFCALDTFQVGSGWPPSISVTGKCICFDPIATGSSCETPVTTSSSSPVGAVGTLVLTSIAIYTLTQGSFFITSDYPQLAPLEDVGLPNFT